MNDSIHGEITASEPEDRVTELIGQQAAISEVLRAIASSPHDMQPIFDAIVDSVTRLCRADIGSLRLFPCPVPAVSKPTAVPTQATRIRFDWGGFPFNRRFNDGNLDHHGAPPRCYAVIFRRFEKCLFLKDFSAVGNRWRRGRASHPSYRGAWRVKKPCFLFSWLLAASRIP
jgi:hypothetical protein